VPELSHETAEDGFHEIQLSGKQLVFLFIVTTSVVVGVFLFGVLVGRGAREPKVEDATPVGATETTPAAPVAQAGPPAIEPPAPAADAPDKVDYNAPKGETATPDASKHPVEESKPAAPVSEAAKDPAAKPSATPAAPAKPPAAATAKPPETAPAPVPAASAAGVPSTAQPGTWLVQVMATREQGIATALVKKLAGKGYPAFLVNPVAGAPQAFYKVQIGRYKDRAEAERVSLRIKKEEKFQSWILR